VTSVSVVTNFAPPQPGAPMRAFFACGGTSIATDGDDAGQDRRTMGARQADDEGQGKRETGIKTRGRPENKSSCRRGDKASGRRGRQASARRKTRVTVRDEQQDGRDNDEERAMTLKAG
jgi:hypothetical protein